VLILALVVSLGFNLYNNFVISNQTQTDMNNVRTEALQGWLGEMWQVAIDLNTSTNNYDIKQAWLVVDGEKFAGILNAFGSSEKLYSQISSTTFYLSSGLEQMFFGNETGLIVTRDLDQTELSMVKELTQNLDGLLFTNDTRVQWFLSTSGVDPTQQLQNQGINITGVLGYLTNIAQISSQIQMMYYD
jgi:hypothetical protein